MKTLFIFLALLVNSVCAQTNSIIFPQLLSVTNSILMTNAEFRVITGTRVIFKANDNYQSFEASNLNVEVLNRLGVTVDQLESKIKSQIAKQQAAQAAYQKSLAALARTNQEMPSVLIDAEAKQMEKAGMVELTKKFIETFPEKVNQKQGWLDGEFVEIDSSSIGYLMDDMYKNFSLGFTVKDKNGDYFRYCYAQKDKFADLVLKLKKGDRIRVKGKVTGMATSVHWLYVESIQVLK